MRAGASKGGAFKRIVLGRALASHQAEHQLLPKILALPVFSSDPLSSNAYATQEMMLVLVAAGAGALALGIPIALAIAALLAIVVTSYRQTVRAYPRGGGSYIVARENLGTIPGLTAAAAILIDYVLTVSVSVTAGTVAITAVAPDALVPYSIPIAVVLVLFVMMMNLRGVKEAGTAFAVPTYGFVVMIAITLAWGFVRCLSGCPVAETADLPLPAETTLTLFLVLRAFSSGATALTGVEAIADGVQAFRRPQAKNAATTLLAMGIMSTSMFLGITLLADRLEVRIDEAISQENPVLAQIGDTIFNGGFLYLVLQVFTAGILVLAANTAFQDFPRLSSILARDRFMPSQFANRGDRLVYSNGVLLLSLFAIALIWIFDANLSRLIQLYVVGVFTAFTLSQTGMVRRWVKRKEPGWQRAAIINGVGAFTTGVVLVIVTITKFSHGAWIVIAAMPVIVTFFWSVHHHYEKVARVLALGRFPASAQPTNEFLLLVSDLGPATREAIRYLLALRPDRVTALWVGPASGSVAAARAWSEAAPRLGELHPLEGAEAHLVRAVRRAVRDHRSDPTGFVTVIVPEVVSGGLLRYLIQRRASVLLKAALLFEPGVVLTDVAFVSGVEIDDPDQRPLEPERSVVIVPVSAVNDASIRAVVYARSLTRSRVEALYLMMDPEEQEVMIRSWHEHELDVPLVIADASFRDLGGPLLREVRRHTARAGTVVTVVLPELVPRHWWENLLHNQTALYVKRLLLFEPEVVLTSVPFHLAHAEVSRPATRPEP